MNSSPRKIKRRMAHLKKGILDAFIGKVGTVVGTTYRGKAIMKSAPIISNKNRSDEQKAVTLKMTVLSKRLHLFKEAIDHGFIETAELVPWNLATRANFPLLEPDGDSYKLDPEKIILSEGNEPFDISVQRSGANLTLSWTIPGVNDPYYGGSVVLALHNTANGHVRIHTFPISSDEANATISPYLANDSDEIHAYAFASTTLKSSLTIHSII